MSEQPRYKQHFKPEASFMDNRNLDKTVSYAARDGGSLTYRIGEIPNGVLLKSLGLLRSTFLHIAKPQA